MKSSNERRGGVRSQRDSVGSRLFCTRIRHGQYNGYLTARSSSPSYCTPPIKLFKVRHYPARSPSDFGARYPRGAPTRTAEGSRRVSHGLGHASFWSSWRQVYHGLFQLSVSIGRSSRRTIDRDRDNDGVWEAYNVMYKGMEPLSSSLSLRIEEACEPARKCRLVSIASYLLTIKTWLYDAAVTGDLDHSREQVPLAKSILHAGARKSSLTHARKTKRRLSATEKNRRDKYVEYCAVPFWTVKQGAISWG